MNAFKSNAYEVERHDRAHDFAIVFSLYNVLYIYIVYVVRGCRLVCLNQLKGTGHGY